MDIDHVTLDQALLSAHETGDAAVLAALYARAADLREGEGRIDAACFYLTQAFVYALDAGDVAAQDYRDRLKAQGREE